MKGSATIIGLISGRSAASRQIVGRSAVRGQVRGILCLPRTCPLTAAASRTRETGLYRYLHVWPEQPQQLVWLNPQMGIDYQIETSTDLEWQIK